MPKTKSAKSSPRVKTDGTPGQKSGTSNPGVSKATGQTPKQTELNKAIADLGAAVAEMQAFWFQETGQQMPMNCDEMKYAARLAGWDPADAIRGEYTANDIFMMAKASHQIALHEPGKVTHSLSHNSPGRKPKSDSVDERKYVFSWREYQASYEGHGKATKRKWVSSLPEVQKIKTAEAREKEIARILRVVRNKRTRDCRKGIKIRVRQRTK